MIDTRTAAIHTAPLGALLLRVGLGVLFLAHLGLKVFVFTPAGTAGFFGKLGLPPDLAYLVMLIELVAGVGLILGVFTRWAALLGIPVILGTIVTVHGSNGFFFSDTGGGWEFPAFWALALLVQAALGDGAFALGPALLGRRQLAQPA